MHSVLLNNSSQLYPNVFLGESDSTKKEVQTKCTRMTLRDKQICYSETYGKKHIDYLIVGF